MPHIPPNFGFNASILLKFETACALDILAKRRYEMFITAPGMTVGITRYEETRLWQELAMDITLVLHGHLYNGVSLRRVVDLYQTFGDDFAKELNGSFVLLLVDERRSKVVLATDRLASRKLYVRETGSAIEVSTRFRHLAKSQGLLDPVGLAWILSSGVPFRNRTVFRDVRRMARASYRCINATSSGSDQAYWMPHYTGEYSGRPREHVRAEFAELLVQSVRKCVPWEGPVTLSLSAGYDATGIGGILTEILQARNVTSFSYGLEERQRGSDAQQTRRLAKTWGIRHRFLLSHDGRLGEAIERNAQWGDGLSNFCDESLAWQSLLDESDGKMIPILTGEECFGWDKVEKPEEILTKCGIRTISQSNWMREFLPPSTGAAFLAGQTEDVADLLNVAPTTNEWNDIKDWIYQDQRLCHFLLPWRENYAGCVFRVIMPYLENDILDFVAKLPALWRERKNLFKESIVALLPKTFTVPRATHGGYVPDWAAEIAREKNWLVECHLSERTSPLDDYIPPESIEAWCLSWGNNLAGKLHGGTSSEAPPAGWRGKCWACRPHPGLPFR